MTYQNIFRKNLAIILCLNYAMAFTQGDFVTSSILKDGSLYKIGVTETGIYKIDFSFINEHLISNSGSISSSEIKIFGNLGGPVPELISGSHADGLFECPLFIRDGSDGRMDPGDYILFYAQGASIWTYDEKDNIHHKPMNVYDALNYYFIKISPEKPKHIPVENYLDEAVSYVTPRGDLALRYEEDRTNLLHPFFASQGSGQRWFGDRFKGGAENDYQQFFDFSSVPLNSNIKIFSSFVARSGRSTSFRLILNNEMFQKNIARTDISNVEANYVNEGKLVAETQRKDTDFKLTVEFPAVSEPSDGWLDYIELHADQNLEYKNDPLKILDYNSINFPYTKYSIKNNGVSLKVWDVTFPWEVKEIATEQQSSKMLFTAPADLLRSFIAFDAENINDIPEFIGGIENQDLHAIHRADMVVLYHPNFESAALRYQAHRSDFSNLVVEIINVEHVYNEFSSGRVDPSAIRNFVRMIHQRDTSFRYLLLFGDASFDYRQIYSEIPFQNFVPTYETKQSFNPVISFPSDDYFGLLSNNEGDAFLRGALDLAIGRIPVKSSEEAEEIIDKIIHYETSSDLFGNWKLKAGFIADDEDGSSHLDQSDGIAESFGTFNKEYNLEKIYFDAFKQESTPGGERYPSVNEKINTLFTQGAFVINYMGHGGPKGWSDERVLELTDIESWNNYDNLPLLVTATCTFTGFDDPSLVSPGELSFLNSKGGVIGLFSTVRAVYSNSNRRLAKAVFDHLTQPIDGQKPTLGEVLSTAKNSNAADTLSSNARKFLLIGDPSMRLNYPEHQVVTTTIVDAETGKITDTLNALQKVTFEGEIQTSSGDLLSDFNGIVYPTLYDKRSSIQTLQQNVDSQLREFQIQKNVLFNGSVTVTGGKFSFTFVLPKDIDYAYGTGKMSYYATDLASDASGYYSNLVIGGSSSNSLDDDLGPEITLFINDRSFIDGGISDENPVLLVDLTDDSGLNVSGNSIGHDLIAVLDDDTKNSSILNEFYVSQTDEFTTGSVSYQYNKIKPGKHTIKVKAWDIANNSSEATISFEVLERAKDISKAFAYPNPLVESTQIFFEHGLDNVELDVTVIVYNAQGQEVALVEANTFSNGYVAGPIKWNGTSGAGNALPQGVYFYRILAETVRGKKYNLDSSLKRIVLTK